jgi:hypothetical protein
MKHLCRLSFLVLSVTLVVAGCKEAAPDKTKAVTTTDKATGTQPERLTAPVEVDPEIEASLNKLTPEDRRLAEAQRLCPVSNHPLGSMNVPPKITIEGQTVFLCCKACENDALANADRTLAKAKELKEKTAGSK